MTSYANCPVLVVDDSETMRKVLRGMLSSIGFRNIHESADGMQAMAKIQANAFSLIISDYHMETMDGLALLKEVKRTSRPGANKFIFMTSENTFGTKTNARMDGAEAFLPKPFDHKALKATIDKVLR